MSVGKSEGKTQKRQSRTLVLTEEIHARDSAVEDVTASLIGQGSLLMEEMFVHAASIQPKVKASRESG